MRTSAYLLRKSAPAAVGRPGPRTRTGTAGWTRRSRGPPYSMERATGHPRICFANTHRLQAPVGAFALLATNASRLLNARTLAGSSPGAW